MTQAHPYTSRPRAEKFSYACHRCLACCNNKIIQINPYEVARLARKLGLSTSEFRDAWTADGAGTTLKQTASGACAFLGDGGCTVHSDRPLVCRLYPLGRHVARDGSERFSHLEGHARSAGVKGRDGTIAAYLDNQGAADFMTAADEYFQWLCAAHDALAAADQPVDDSETATSCGDPEITVHLLDMDTAIARHCAAEAIDEPQGIEDRKRLHLTLLYRALNPQKELHHDHAY